MKLADIEKIHEAGLISGGQRDQIITHFNLKEEGGKFLAIISFLGSVLIAAGIVLLISAHWNEIPHGMKLAAGLALMLGAHGAGWWLREVQGHYRKTGEALQFLGSALFLANIALVGQIYHLASRLPDAFLLWWLGLAALPWLLRSKAQFVLLLAAFAAWFGCEVNAADSLIHVGNNSQSLAYALLGLNYVGFGYWLRRTSFAGFAPVAEKSGMLGLLCFAYPLTWSGFLDWGHNDTSCRWLVPVLALLAAVTTSGGVRQLPGLTRQWRLTWAGSLVAVAALLAWAGFSPHEQYWSEAGSFGAINGIAALMLFVFCLLQIQTGLQLRARSLINLGVAFIGLDIISAYFGLFGTMMRTGLAFVVTGVFLIVFGLYLEWQRRKLMRQIKSPAHQEVP